MLSRAEELRAALMTDNVALLTKLLTPQNVNLVDTERRLTLLIWAVDLGKHDIAEILLFHGASLYPRDIFQFHVFHHAAWYADVRMMELLLFFKDAGVCKNSKGASPLRVDSLQFRPGAKVLVDLPHPLTKRTPLMLAALRGDAEMVEFLITKAGANVHLKDENGNTVMDLAASCGHKDVVILLLSKGDDITFSFENARLKAEENCEKAATIKHLELMRELNVILCRDWLPQSLVAIS